MSEYEVAMGTQKMDQVDTESNQGWSYPLHTIYFYLTRGCNLRCRHCWITPKFQTEEKQYPSLDLDLFRSILDQAKPLGLSSVKFTGGEPLIHPHIKELLTEVQSRNLGFGMETNGIACTWDLARRLKTCRSAHVSVSVDGSEAETHEWVRGVPGCFDKALEGVKNLVSVGFRPQIIMSVMRRNRDQMESLVRLAESLGAGSVKFNIVQPTARGEQMHNNDETLTIEELVDLGSWVENELAPRFKIRLYHSHPAAFRPLGRIFGSNDDGCGVCGIRGILGVLGDGNYALCGIGETVPELGFGNAAKDNLEDVWKNTPLLREIREGLPNRFKGFCGDCLMKARCLGSCLAQNYYSTGDLWSPYWYCSEARERGLFPLSRLAKDISVSDAQGDEPTATVC
jgi:SynChlorMet cassette radical SAM/SPASM protein ScmF